MPVRGEGAAPKADAKVVPIKTPAKQTQKTPAAPPVSEKETVQKYPMEEKARRFLKEIDPKLESFIYETVNREVKGEDGGKIPVVFMAFSPKGENDEEPDLVFNIDRIKDILFHYHTTAEKIPTGKQMVLEVLPATKAEDPHMLVFQEI